MNLPSVFKGAHHAIMALIVVSLNTIINFFPVLMIGLIKLLPSQRLKLWCSKAIDQIATVWMSINNAYLQRFNPAIYQVTGLIKLYPEAWYLVIANHQSWLDILVLHRLFNRKIPVLKFFIKDQLKWVPFLGFAWWAMGCPFMKRYSKSYLEKHPEKKGHDIKSTLKAMDVFKLRPTSVMNFVEGTRYTEEKAILQHTPFTHLLKPKAGGISFAVGALHEKLSSIVDVTILYPEKQVTLWDFLCHRLEKIKVMVREIQIPSQFLTPQLPYDETMQSEFRYWLNTQWAIKDQLLSSMARSG